MSFINMMAHRPLAYSHSFVKLSTHAMHTTLIAHSASLLLAFAAFAQFSNTPEGEPAKAVPQPQVLEEKPAATPTPANPDDFRAIGVGDPAPTLNGATWIQGDRVTAFEPGSVYVVDFWATWCGPCIAFIPELNAIHNDYAARGVRVIGVSIWENSRNSDAGVDYVKRVTDFVKGRRDMTYAIAYGGDDGVLSQRWMNGAGRVSIPTVFLIDKQGRVAWVGHPRMGLKEKLDALIEGKLDSATEQAASKAREDLRRQAFKLATPMQKAIESKDWDKAIGYLDEILKLDAEMFAPSAVAKLRLLITGKQDMAAASAFAKTSLETYKDNARTLADMSVVMLTQGDAATRDLETAGKLADRAMELKPDHPRSMRARAEYLWATGKQDDARALITKAVGLAGLDEQGDVLESANKMK